MLKLVERDIVNKLNAWLKHLGVARKILLGLAVVVVVATAASSSHPTNLTPVSKTNSAAVHQSTEYKPVVTTKNITDTQSVPFTSSTVNDPVMLSGQTKVTTAGVNGSETLAYQVTYTDGQQTDKKLINTTVDVQPINQVTSLGTYVAPPAPSCPNGTYVNSAGNTVCSPYSSPSAPPGATAQCVDGTYSFSQSRSGTCSHHGGVAQWL
jgi:hypothetical protein